MAASKMNKKADSFNILKIFHLLDTSFRMIHIGETTHGILKKFQSSVTFLLQMTLVWKCPVFVTILGQDLGDRARGGGRRPRALGNEAITAARLPYNYNPATDTIAGPPLLATQLTNCKQEKINFLNARIPDPTDRSVIPDWDSADKTLRVV
ncbi:hypothetical protein J6590_029184 [Homalodisca vitripennis]|nr:hypothetical protein J6590_029184 [Homalodisca vitripennis]